MRQSQRLFTAGVLLAVAASVFIGLLAVPKREAVGATTPQVIPQMFTLFVIPQTGSTESQIQGTGTLINQTQGNIATARHVIEALEKMPRSALFAQVDGVLYPLEALWKHKTADIAVVRFVEKNFRRSGVRRDCSDTSMPTKDQRHMRARNRSGGSTAKKRSRSQSRSLMQKWNNSQHPRRRINSCSLWN